MASPPTFSPSSERMNGQGRPAGKDPYLLLASEYGPHKGYGEAFRLISRLADEAIDAGWWWPARWRRGGNQRSTASWRRARTLIA